MAVLLLLARVPLALPAEGSLPARVPLALPAEGSLLARLPLVLPAEGSALPALSSVAKVAWFIAAEAAPRSVPAPMGAVSADSVEA